MVADLNAEAAQAVAAEVGGLAQAVDVSNNASVHAMAAAAFAALGTPDILCLLYTSPSPRD